MATITGTGSDETLTGSMSADEINGRGGADIILGRRGDDLLSGGTGDDTIDGGRGDDTVFGGAGDDVAKFAVSAESADVVDLGDGDDSVLVNGPGVDQVRLTFTSAEVGNASANDFDSMINQDGGLAVRLQSEDGSDGLTGGISRFDDEGISFVAGPGLTFDVRDLVSGAARGDGFDVVTLGTLQGDAIDESGEPDRYYVNGGMGDDTLTGGEANDFLVGGAGADSLVGAGGNDSFIGGGGNDSIAGGFGTDVAIFDVTTGGSDSVDLGSGDDLVNVSGPGVSQVRLTFTSAEVGNGAANDSGAMSNQDGGLAVRLQAEDGAGALTGAVSRFDDEGVSFVAASGTTLDVRDLVSGVARGDLFNVVTLGTLEGDVINESGESASYYINGGMGADRITGGDARDFLVGGAGDDKLAGGGANDSFIGGGGNDAIDGQAGIDTAIYGGTAAGVTVDLRASGAQSTGGAGVDKLNGIENLTGSSFADGLAGDKAGNVLNGADGDDDLAGRSGADTLIGGAGDDLLRGGLGADTFVFQTLESGVGGRIADLSDDDTIDLSAIDADTTQGGDQAFDFVDEFSGTAGEAVLSYDAGRGNTRLLLDVDGDAIVDMRVILNGDDYSDFSSFVA